ncbi:protein NO VEIN domain-containing protein [Modestobacter roseus]|uniref:protein NO VEIN domain-containing protein n=1 Tax=Modestobacter roseus TaxID=1181884 RepID=UPI001296123A|nr:DUF3883 domain-containing protein [Modestobacter roseus]MQA35958.1 hypothetical protein [Modestobacter roseus]
MDPSNATPPPISGIKAIEDAAIAFVIEQETKEGRTARDTRQDNSASADLISGDRIIEVKAAGTSSRGYDLWLEPAQYHAARADPDHSWLYLVENVRQGDPENFRLLRLGGQQLSDLLVKARRREYFTVPVPVAVHDALSEHL